MFTKKSVFSIVASLLSLVVSVQAQSDIRKVDFKNFTYEMTDEDDKKIKVTVKDGDFLRKGEGDNLFNDLYFEVSGVEYGDLTGDGQDEAIVRLLYNTGGSGNFTYGSVFTMKNGKPVVLTEFEGGDRAYGGIVSAKVVGNLLLVERNSAGDTGAACCPEFIETTGYKWNGNALVQVGEIASRELYPATRVSFKKGTSISVFPLKFPAGDIRRFVVGARGGQTLLISTNAKPSDVYFRLVSGDGAEKQLPNGMSVKLNGNGDYVFELSNSTGKDLTVSVKVAIN